MLRVKAVLSGSLGVVVFSALLQAQAPATPPRRPAPEPWRFAGTRPCVGPEGGALQCPPAAQTMAVRAGRLFDSVSGQMLTKQVVLLQGERITDVGPEAQIKIPAGAQVIDLSQATVLPGPDRRAHPHVQQPRAGRDDRTGDADRDPERSRPTCRPASRRRAT